MTPGRASQRSAPWRPARTIAGVLAICVALLCLSWQRGEAQTKSFLWRASSGARSIFLVGSVHMLTSDYYPLSPALDHAFKASDLLVEELDLGEMTSRSGQLELLTRGLLPPGQTLEKVVSPSTYALVSARLTSLGLPVEPLQRFKPWSIALTLLGFEWQKAGFDAGLGLDKHFYDRAKEDGKPIQGLESVAYQISRFDDMTMADQERFLAQTLKELDAEKANIKMLANAWRAGDAATIERVVLQEVKTDPVLYRRLLVERNAAWLPTIVGLLERPRPSFVVIGAAHLVGPDGLLALLRSKGVALEQQ